MAMNTVLIIGAGEIGLALAHVLTGRCSVTLWDRDPKKSTHRISLEEALENVDIVFLCVPAVAFGEVIPIIQKHCPTQTAIVILSKGLFTNGQTIDRVLDRALPGRYALLSGPMIAEEIMSGRHAFGVVATADRSLYMRVEQLLNKTTLAIQWSPDVAGVAIAAVLKNIYAILFGIIDGMELGDNVRGWLAVEMLHEMETAIKRSGGDTLTASSVAGLGDAIATGTSERSINYMIGVHCAHTDTAIDIHGEGMRSVEILWGSRKAFVRRLPLVTLTYHLTRPRARRQILLDRFIHDWGTR